MTTCLTSAQRIPAKREAAETPIARVRYAAATLATFGALLGTSMPAAAVDGCQVLLCLAAPSWRNIPQCVPTITQLLRDLARGKPFPVCSMAGSGNTASNAWASAPGNCPPQYTKFSDDESGRRYYCDYDGAVSVAINGTPFARTWWATDGNTVTEFSPAGKAQLGQWDTRFDDDYAAWLGTRPTSSAPAN